MNNNANNNSKHTLKRRNESTATVDNTKRARPRLDMSKGPRIPVRPTLASRSNANSPTVGRLSNASTSSNTSTTSFTGRLSNGSTSSIKKRPSNIGTSTPSSSTSSVVKKIKAAPTKPTITKKRTSLPNTTSNSTTLSKPTSKSTSILSKFPRGDIKSQMNQLQNKLEETGGEVQEIEKLHNDLQSTVQSKESLLQEAMEKVADLEQTKQTMLERHQEELQKIQDKHNEKNRQLIFEHDRDKKKLEQFDEEIQGLEVQYRNILSSLEDERKENEVLKSVKEKINVTHAEVDSSLRHLKMKLKSAGTSLADHERTIEELKNILQEKNDSCRDMEGEIREGEKLRRKLHNTIQELKGNIRVFCRVRPSISDNKDLPLTTMRFFGEDQDKMEISEESTSTFGKVSVKTHEFAFDRVFSPKATQLDCYEEISQLVQSALDGYNVCIFAYGQTGSGKTFTMLGPNNNSEETMGMIPRAVHQIYDVAQGLKQTTGWEYTMEGQFLEIYNETIHDLLGEVSNYGKLKHEIHHEKNGRTTVTEMTSVKLDSPNKVKSMLRKANLNRATGATNLNERSSRSHSVFTLQLSGYNRINGEKTTGVLNLIDLAGSERVSKSGSEGDRLRETRAINKSLSCLSTVIQALVEKKEGGHIPYRDSKLTWLLRNSLGGNCKTLMFVNVSPLMEHYKETMNSLRFATMVNSCQIGTAKEPSK